MTAMEYNALPDSVKAGIICAIGTAVICLGGMAYIWIKALVTWVQEKWEDMWDRRLGLRDQRISNNFNRLGQLCDDTANHIYDLEKLKAETRRLRVARDSLFIAIAMLDSDTIVNRKRIIALENRNEIKETPKKKKSRSSKKA